MDNFIDKLAQKFSPNEMIKANSSAEAKETERLRKKMDEYQKLLQDMKLVNLKQQESAQLVSDMLEQLQSKQTHPSDGAGLGDTQLEELFQQTNANIHTENVKVYRNVQAILDKGLEESTDSIMNTIDNLLKTTRDELEHTNEKIKGLKRFVFFALIAVLCDIVINVMQYIGIGF